MTTRRQLTSTNTGCGAWEQRHSRFLSPIQPCAAQKWLKDYVLKAKSRSMVRSAARVNGTPSLESNKGL
ncbi:hypothetical protein N9L65_00390 [Candidatus Poseidoniales archaeon]|nr:hypothetical protein [Candidatus Poseidoniales archaeon]